MSCSVSCRRRLATFGDHAPHRPALPDVPGEAPGIHVFDHWNPRLIQPVGQRTVERQLDVWRDISRTTTPLTWGGPTPCPPG